MKLIDLLIGETSYRFERDSDGTVWIYDEVHSLCATVGERGEYIEYYVTDAYNSGTSLMVIDITALRQLEKIAGKIAEDLEDES